MIRRTLPLLTAALLLAAWLGADTKNKAWPVNAIRAAIEVTQHPDNGGYTLHYHKTGQVQIDVTAPTLREARTLFEREAQNARLTLGEFLTLDAELQKLEAQTK